VVIATSAVLVLGACSKNETSTGTSGGTTPSGAALSGAIRIDGSSTVAPLSEAAAEIFQSANAGVKVTVGTSGTGGGFEKFCNKETDISDASRPIKQSEKDACAKNGVTYEELTVANDGLSVVVSPQNTWAKCLTVEQLKKVWAPGSTVNNWNQIDPSFPDEKLTLFGAGTDSGTFDYFTEAINGKAGESRTDYEATEDDNRTVQGVSGTKGAMGYFGLSYLEENEGKVKGLGIDGGKGCVEPSLTTVQDGTYKPLGRPLFVYPSKEALQRPEVKAFLQLYITNNESIAKDALFVPLTAEQKKVAQDKVNAITGGK